MDLSQMTRDELEREAQRRGLRDASQLTRGQLIRALSAPTITGALDTAKAIVRGVLGVARTLRGRSSPPPAPRRDSDRPPAAAMPLRTPPAAVPMAVEPTPIPPVEDGPPTPEPVSVSVLGDLADEPIPTRTMARLLHEQGHHRRALAILEKLASQHPGDVGIDTELSAVRLALGMPAAALTPDTKTSSSPRAELVAMLLPDRRVLLAWGLSAESITSARSMGASGTLVARVLVLAPSGSHDVTRTQTDTDVQPVGEHTFGPIAAGSFVTAAVGFRNGEQFVSVAAAPVLDVH